MNLNAILTPAWTRALAAVAIAAMLSSCAHLNPTEPGPAPEPEPVAQKKPPPKPMKPPPPSKLYEWWGKDYVSRIEISINEQKARFFSGDELVGWTTVASGVHKYPTPTGSFAIIEKVQNKESNLYGKIYNKNGKLVRRGAKMGVHPVPVGGRFKGAPMPYFLRLTNDGIGLHAGPIPRPGNRASHGCIRMPKQFAPVLYNHVDIGTEVAIKGNGPSYGDYLAKQRRSAPRPTKTAVAKTTPAPSQAPAGATVISTGTVADSQQPEAPPSAAAPAAAPTVVATPQTVAPVTAPAPSAPTMATPPAPGVAGVPASTSAYAAPAPVPTAETAAPTPSATGMGMGASRVHVAPIAAPPPIQSYPSPSVTSAPSATPATSIPAPAPAAVTPPPEAQQKPPPAPPSGMTGTPAQPPQQQTSSPIEAPPPSAPANPVVQTQD